MSFISLRWLIILLCAAGWTTFFSMFNTPGIRGYRNFGMLACFVIGPIMLFALPWKVAVATWCLIGAASGVLYFFWELYVHWNAKAEEQVPWPGPSTILNGLYLWPIMLPEAVEYWLADLGIRGTGAAPKPIEPTDTPIANAEPPAESVDP